MTRSAYRPGSQRRTFRISGLAATGGAGYWALWENRDSTIATAGEVSENPDPPLAALQTEGSARPPPRPWAASRTGS
ncbi:hypothetical protein [Streptomyces sp. NPDC002078]